PCTRRNVTARKNGEDPCPLARFLLRNDASGNSHQHSSTHLANASNIVRRSSSSRPFFAIEKLKTIPCSVSKSTLFLRRSNRLLAQIYQQSVHSRLWQRSPVRRRLLAMRCRWPS